MTVRQVTVDDWPERLLPAYGPSMDEIAPHPLYAAPPPALDTHVLAVERRDDPLDLGFLLCDGLLAPLPPKVRLPHEDEELEGEELEPA